MSDTTNEGKLVLLQGLAPVSQDDISGLIGAGSILPRVQLMAFTSGPVQDGLIQPGHYALIGDGVIVDLGTSFECIPLDFRPKAMRTNDDGVLVSWDKGTPLWCSIADCADSPSQEVRSGNMYGLDFLIWLPENGFVSYYAGSKTSRRAASRLVGLTKERRPTHFESELITKGKLKWYGPKHAPSEVPFAVLPDLEKANEALAIFRDQQSSQLVETSERD